MKFLLFLILLFHQNCIQNIMQCPTDVVTLKEECNTTTQRAKINEDMILVGVGIAAVGYINLLSEPSSVAGITSRHNEHRASEGASLPDLVWSPAVASYALKKVTYLANNNNCTMSHSAGPTNPGYGENLAWASFNSYTAIQATDAWYNEKPDYDYATNTCASGRVCGHYTQVVWKNSRHLGCAGVVCPNGGGIIYGCNYDPPGNYTGQKPY
jgi:pathogenesis-related protein 1